MELYLDLMKTRTGYLIKHTLSSARYNPMIALSQGDEGRIVSENVVLDEELIRSYAVP